MKSISRVMIAAWCVSAAQTAFAVDPPVNSLRETPARPAVTIEVRHFRATEALMQETVRAIGIQTFATAAQQNPDEEATKLEPFRLPESSPRVHVARAVSVLESPLTTSVQAISREQSQKFLKAITQNKHTNVMQAPRLTVNDGDTGHIQDLQRRPFVTGIIAGDLKQDPVDLKPVVHVMETGTRLQIRVQASAPGERQCDLRWTDAEITSVRERSTGMGASLVQIPERAANHVAISAKLSNEEQLLVWWPHLNAPARTPHSAVTRAAGVLSGTAPEMVAGMLIRIQDAPEQP